MHDVTKWIVLDRDKYTCQRCGTKWEPTDSKRCPDVHHIIPRRLGGSDNPDNLTTYCRQCHLKVEPRNLKHTVSKVISLVIPEEMLAALDEIRGDVPRSAYIRRLIEVEK